MEWISLVILIVWIIIGLIILAKVSARIGDPREGDFELVGSFLRKFPLYTWGHLTADGLEVWVLFALPSVALSEILMMLFYGGAWVLRYRIY